MSILAALVPSRFLYYTDIIKSKEGTLMTKQEISEIKKLFTPKNCSITRICGCYVDGEKNKKTELKQAFLALPEEEMFKYFEILRKSLSGTIGKNLLNLEFPLKSETEGGTQEFLLRLRDSRLKDDALLEQFYDRIIESYEYVGNYLILLIHDAYDVPGRTRDGIEMEDASDEVYDYILTCICPVDLSKPGLSYNAVENTFQNRIRDWVVGMPDAAFLFPAFNDRMEVFDQCFDATAGEDTSLMMTNVYNPRSFEVKTPDVVIKVNPERTDLVNTKLVDGRQCLVIELDGNIEVNGITVRAAGSGDREESEE